MKKEIKMPALSSTMKEGKIVSWSKKVGDKISSGDVLLVVESDKADMDVESFEDGYLSAILTPEGGVAEVGAIVAVIVDSASEVGQTVTVAINNLSSKAPELNMVSSEVVALENAPKYDQILMPALSSTMKEGKIVSWAKKVGDKVSSGDVLLVVESDKADMDVESFEEGYLASILVKDGDSAAVGAPVAALAKTSAEIAAVQSFLSKRNGQSNSNILSNEAVTSSLPTGVNLPKTTSPVVNAGNFDLICLILVYFLSCS